MSYSTLQIPWQNIEGLKFKIQIQVYIKKGLVLVLENFTSPFGMSIVIIITSATSSDL